MRAVPHARWRVAPRSGFMGFGGATPVAAGDPCRENFWSAACWFGSGGAQSLGIDAAAGTIKVTPPSVSNCAGTLKADGTCVPLVQPNDPSNTTEQLNETGGNFQDAYGNWVKRTTDSANVPQGNTAGSGALWMLGGIALLFVFVGGKRY